jgi:hypothetical protein
MNRIAGLVIAGLVLMVGVPPSWGGPPNPTESDESANTAGGTGALKTLEPGTDGDTAYANTAFGFNALYWNTSGSQNTAIGRRALFSNTTGVDNTASGDIALSHNTSGWNNTANGSQALVFNTTGVHNTASGAFALFNNTTGDVNTASGVSALEGNTSGSDNTANGQAALHANTTGSLNTASGRLALGGNVSGTGNTALGFLALKQSTGNRNIAVGQEAGAALTSGNKNIYLGHPGAASESRTMRLGSVQTKTFIAGVATTPVSGTNVTINANGQLGTLLSSARYKRDIETMGTRSEGVLKLRPVTFVYKQDEQGVRQYGLIAEEVATVYPELVTHTATGEVQGVRYQELIPLLLNEVQRQQQAMERQQQVTEHLQRELAELRSLVGQMRGGLAAR